MVAKSASAPRQDWGRPRESPGLTRQVVFTLVLLAIAAGIYYGIPFLLKVTTPESVKVAALVGVQEPIALDILHRDGLLPQVVRREFSETVKLDAVINTSPPAGRIVRRGRTINLVVSAGSSLRAVPSLIGMTRRRATEQLQDLGLHVGQVDEEPSEGVPPGRVISQTPEAGAKVRIGQGVALVVSTGGAQGPEPSPGLRTEKSALVDITVTGSGVQEVKIVVSDDDGERVAYKQFHSPGDVVQVRVSGRGAVLIKLYSNDRLLEAKQL